MNNDVPYGFPLQALNYGQGCLTQNLISHSILCTTVHIMYVHMYIVAVGDRT